MSRNFSHPFDRAVSGDLAVLRWAGEFVPPENASKPKPLRGAARLDSSLSGAISVIQNRRFEILIPLVAFVSAFPALGSELSVEPSPLETGSELVVHLSSTRYGDCWDGPLPFVSSQGVTGDALTILVSGTDYVECNATPLDLQIPLGTIPAGITSVQLYGCGNNPIPGAPYCSSSPFLTFPVGDVIFRNSFE